MPAIMHSQIIDLTQTLTTGMPDWDGCCGFQMRKVVDYAEGLCVQALQTPNGIGTHIDAPCHFFEGSLDIAALPLDHLICPGVVINVSHKMTDDYAISVDDLLEFEQQYGRVPKGSVVIGYTGWGSRWDCPEAYRNVDAQGMMHFPRFSLAAAEYLLEREVRSIAIDTLSPDGSDDSFPVHHKILGAGQLIIENIKVADTLPVIGFTLVALPIKIKNATEAPCRVIAIVNG